MVKRSENLRPPSDDDNTADLQKIVSSSGEREQGASPLIGLVDDDPVFLSMLSGSLTSRGMRCLPATSYAALLEHLQRDEVPDAFLLDYHLGTSRETGLSVCRSLRLRYDRPVLMLTGDSHTDTIVRCLEAGAEQYLVKPCAIDELLARLRVVLRQRQPSRATTGDLQTAGSQGAAGLRLSFGSLSFDEDQRLLYTTGQPAKTCTLTEKEADLLRLMLSSPDHTISRADAFYRLHHYEMEPENRSIDVMVSKLRRKIAKLTHTIEIQSLRGQGYRLVVADINGSLDDSHSVSTAMSTEQLAQQPLLDAGQLALTLDSDDPELQRQFYGDFLEHVNAEFVKLRDSRLTQGSLKAMAHQLKSSSQSIGTPRFTQALLGIEAANQNDDDLKGVAARTALEEAIGVWDETRAAIEQRITDLGTG